MSAAVSPSAEEAPRLELTGDLTINTIGEHKTVILEAVESAAQARAGMVELDLTGVTELDTAGLQLLLVARREAGHFGCRLRLAALSQAASDVLAIAQLDAELAGVRAVVHVPAPSGHSEGSLQ